MSVDISLDKDHDLALDMHLIDGIERIGQQVKVTLLTFLGEWFLDASWGVPVLTKILIKSPRRSEIESIIRAKVRGVPGVVSVPRVDIRIDSATRQAQIVLDSIETDEGVITVEVQHG